MIQPVGRNKRSALRHSRVVQVTDRVEFARIPAGIFALPHGGLLEAQPNGVSESHGAA